VTTAARLGSTIISAILLVTVNAIPLIGVAFWGWSLMMILVLYWIESGIVGFINIFKIARAEGGDAPAVSVAGNRLTVRISGVAAGMGRGAVIGFFVMHYGIFWVVHGIFVFLLPLFAGLSSGFLTGPMDFGPLPLDGLLLSTVLLAASHTVSFFTNYIGRGEYLRATPTGQMMSVYGRVVALHVTIVVGAFVIGMFGAPIAALFLLVGIKTAIDLALHVREHHKALPQRIAGSSVVRMTGGLVARIALASWFRARAFLRGQSGASSTSGERR
jgi:hypothetical protein